MNPLSIVHLFTHPDVTRGGAVQGLLLARALQERGNRVISFFHDPIGEKRSGPGEGAAPFSTGGMDIRRLNLKNPKNYFTFRCWLREESVDVIHAHRNLALLFAYFSTLGRSKPVLVANRGTTYRFQNPLVKHVFHSPRLGHVIAVSNAVKQTLVEEEGMRPEKISVVYGSVDEPRFSPGVKGDAIRKEFRIPDNAPLIVSIGAVDRRKGLSVLVEAAGIAAEAVPGAKFLIVGGVADSRYLEEIRRQIGRLGLEQTVIFTGHRTDIPEILGASDVSVNASTEGEGLTGALRESLAMGKPVVCTRVCGNTELVEDGETGRVVEPGDPETLARAVIEVIDDPVGAQRRAEKGRLRVRTLCSTERRTRRVESIYATLCQGRAEAVEF